LRRWKIEMEVVINETKKKCTKCNEIYVANEDNFYKLKQTNKKLGEHYKLSSWCKKCTKKKNREWYVSNPEKIKVASDRYASQEYVKKRRRKRAAQAREEGKYKEWQQKNKEKIRQYNLERRMNKNHDITEQEWLDCLEFFRDSCAYCGISEQEALLEQGQRLHKEHLEHNGANDIANCVPSCRNCNSSKWEFEFDKWFNENNPIFSKRRYNKIIKWILSFTEEN
jgi:hypothetical protein